MSHTILLMQPNRRQDSRSYADFESGRFSMNEFYNLKYVAFVIAGLI